MKTRAEKFDTTPTVDTDQYGNVWKEKYNIYSTRIGGIIDASVEYAEGKYRVNIGDVTLKRRVDSIDEGKELAVQFVKARLGFLFK